MKELSLHCTMRLAGLSLQGRRLRLSTGSRRWRSLVKITHMENQRSNLFCHKIGVYLFFFDIYSIFGRLQYRLYLLILGFYRVSIYINVSLGDVFVVYIFWKVLTSLKSIYPSSSTSIRRVMPCFSVPKFVSQRIQPRWFRVQLLQNPAFNYAYKSLGRTFPKQRSGIGERFFCESLIPKTVCFFRRKKGI